MFVKIPIKAAIRIQRLFRRVTLDDPLESRAVEDLSNAIEALRKKPKPIRRMRTASERIRREVYARANGACECCGNPFRDFDPATVDHFFGIRKAPETVENCWALRLSCHRAKTAGRPSREEWFELFIAHADRHGYETARHEAANKLTILQIKKGIIR